MDGYAFLNELKTSIESMTKYNQLEVFKILVNSECKLNENKSGAYVNLSIVPEAVIIELDKYVKYINEQETHLITTEYQKNEFKTTMQS